MINQYSGDAPTLRLLCSITGGTIKAQWEDVTGSTPLTFVNDCVSFTTTVSARFWLIDCRQVNEATKFATELYREAIHVPFMAKFVVFAKRRDPLEAQLRVFCMTDDKEDKTLESQEHFTEVAKSRDVEVLEGKLQYLEFAGNLVPVTKSGEQLSLTFQAFRENRLPFTIRVKDPHQEPMGRVAFMREPRVGRGEPPQSPICNLNIVLPEADPTPVSELVTLEKKYGFVTETSLAKPELIHRADLRLSDIAKELRDDWISLALQLDVPESDINTIKSENPNDTSQQALVMLRHWLQRAGSKATGNFLEKGLRKINREDIVNQCMFNVELVTDDVEKAVAKVHLDQSGFDTFKEELGSSRDASLRRETSLNGTYDEQDIMKDAESAAETSSESSDKEAHFRSEARHHDLGMERRTDSENFTRSSKGYDEGPETLVQTVPTALAESFTQNMVNGQLSDTSFHEEDRSEPTVATLSSEATAEMEISSLEDKSQTETHVEKKEWTETDDSGSIRQITQIKTETSIKLEGDGAVKSLKKTPKKEDSDEEKKSSTDSEKEDLSFTEKKSFFQRLSLTSDSLPVNSKWTQDVSLDDLPMAEGEIIQEQISFEDKLKMFEPDEDNRKKIQKRDKSEQPTVYRYDFTKPAKERPVATEFVVSELEKAEEIVKQVSEELNVEENLLNDQKFNLNDKTTDNESDVDSAFTLERVEQEVSSLLAEVDREEKELSNDFHHISSSQVDSNMSTRDSHLSAIRSGSQETENSDFAALSFDSAPKSPVLTEEPCTYIEADVSMQEGEKVTILESDVYKDEKSVDPERCVEVESLAFQLETEEVSETDVPPVVESLGSAHDQHAHHSLSSGDIRVSSVSDEEYTERKLIVDLYKKEEFKEAVKLDEDDSVRDTVKHSQEKPSNLMDISSTVDSHIKSEILREEIDLSIEESPLEVKQIAEDLEHISASEDRKCPVYQHIRTEILTQALGEDIECGSPERKELGTFSLKKSDLSEISGRTTQESSSEISNDKQNNLPRKISPQVSEESAGPTDDISSSEGITVEQDEHLVDYEEAREEHSLTEQLQALASDSLLASKGLMQDVYQTLDFGSHDFDHMSSGMSSSMADVDIPRRGKDVYSRPDKKDIRSLKSTKQVSTIEEHSSIESCDSPQEMALQDLPEKSDLKGSSSDEEHKDKSQDLSSQEMFIADSNQIKTHIVAEVDVNAGFELPSEKKGTTVEEKLLDTDFLDDPGLLSKKSDSFDESRKLPRSESKSSHGKKSDSDAEGSKIESITESAGKRKEESFSSSGETESPYYSVETSDSGRTPRSTPAASRPCSSEFEINVFSGHGSEYETCVTSQEASGSYATAISSQEISYATACSSFSHSSRESAYSVDSESSGHLASVEVSSEASETLVPSAQEMELEFGPDLEMPVLDEEPANYDSLKEPYDMKIPESVIRSGIELPFMKTWDFRDTAPDEKMKQLPQQWTWQYATESEISDKFEVIENNGSIPIDTEVASSATEVHAIEEGVHFSTSVAYTTPSCTQVETGSSSRDIPYHRRSVSSVMDIVLDQERIEQTNSVLDEEQLSVSESSATHSEQTWQTSTDTAVQLSYNAPSSCLAPDSPNFVAASDSCQENLEEALTPEHSFISHPETSYLQLNGPVEVDYNPDYDNLDGDNSQPVSNQNQSYETDGLQFDLEIEGSNAISSDAASQHTSGVNSQSVGDMGSKNNESTSCHTQPSSDYDTQNGRSLDAEKPEAQQEQSFSFSGYSSHRASESRVCPDLTSYLPESDQCDLLPGGIDSLPPSYESEINIPCGESVSSTEAMPTLGTGSQLLPDLQSTDSLERTDIVDTSPEDERYEYKSHKTAATGKSSKDEKTSDAQSASSSVKCDEGDILAESDCVSQVYTSKYDEISGTDLYTHHEEEEFELRESDVYPSPIPSIEEDKQSTPSFDAHPSRRFFPRSGDTSASSSLQEFERLEAEIVAGRLSRSSVDSSEKMAFTKSGEHDDISMSSLTEFEKLEKECVENEPLDRIGVDDVMLSEIEEGLESQSSDVLEILPSSLHDGSDSEYEKRRIDFEEIIKVAQTNVEKFQEETVSEGVTSDECTVLMRVLSETQDTSEGNKVSSKDEATDIEESEPFPPATDVDNLGGGHDSSSSGEKMCGNGKLDCMISSTDSIDPSSSTATHATYQFETDSVMSSSINSAQASGEECTMVSSTDTLEPEPKLTYSIGDTVTDEKTQVSSNVDEPLSKGALACKLEELQNLQSANGAKEQMELFLSKLTDESVLMEDYPSHSFTDIKEDSKPLRASDDLLKTFEAGHGLSASGDSSALDGEDLVSRTTATTTTRIVTTVTTDQNDCSGQEQQTADDSEDLRHSVEVILNQFMSEDSSGIKLEDSSIEHDE
ncbi:ankyrin-2-like isoform X2 [Stegodyphus dumicola]|uniref:ankyrin-2-like isoform X2 n=1 Tax=Stegodyphus dumicola TaxID=202533 RepID=UPI0015B15C11|nr:ankyrin-2-like isoform X2 [Stegodyphus dumicola]